MRGCILFGDLVPKNIGVGHSNPLTPKIDQNTESLKFSIGQNNLNGKFGLNLTINHMPLHDSRGSESHCSVRGVPDGYFFPQGLPRASLPTSAPVRRSFPPFIAPTHLTASTILIATTTFKFTTLRLTPFHGPIVILRNCPMRVLAWGMGFTHPKGAIRIYPNR